MEIAFFCLLLVVEVVLLSIVLVMEVITGRIFAILIRIVLESHGILASIRTMVVALGAMVFAKDSPFVLSAFSQRKKENERQWTMNN